MILAQINVSRMIARFANHLWQDKGDARIFPFSFVTETPNINQSQQILLQIINLFSNFFVQRQDLQAK